MSLSSSTRLEQSVREEASYYKEISSTVSVHKITPAPDDHPTCTSLKGIYSVLQQPALHCSRPGLRAMRGQPTGVLCTLCQGKCQRVCWSEKISSLRKEVAAFDRYQCPCDLIGKVKAKRRDGISRSLPGLGKPLLELNLKPAVRLSFLFRRYKYPIVAN